ncbi:hypothetical protein F7Q95_07335 [Pseudomonas psychrophila]|nr:hypothetical protein F7Q95_07335 [Pseudomonas psychrophila]
MAGAGRAVCQFCGSGLARDAGGAVSQSNRANAIAGKPAPTECPLAGTHLRNRLGQQAQARAVHAGHVGAARTDHVHAVLLA